MAWTPPQEAYDAVKTAPETRVGTEKGRATNTNVASTSAWTPPQEAYDAAKEKGFFKKVGEGVADVAKGIVEVPTTLVTGTGATIAGDALGAALGTANKIRGAFGLEPTAIVRDLKGNKLEKPITTGKDFADAIKEGGTYQPRSTTGQLVNKGVEIIATPITATSRAAGDIVAGATGNELAGDIVSDVGNVLLTKKAIEVAPKVASATKAAGSAAVEAAGPVVKTITDPKLQMGAAGISAAYGNIPQALGHAAVAGGRMLYDKMASRSAGAAETTADAVTPSRIPGVTTAEEAAAIRADIAARRAANQQRLQSEGRDVRSTVNDTAETQYAADAPLRQARAAKEAEAAAAAEKARVAKAAEDAKIADEIASGKRNKWGVLQEQPETAPVGNAPKSTADVIAPKSASISDQAAGKSPQDILAQLRARQKGEVTQEPVVASKTPAELRKIYGDDVVSEAQNQLSSLRIKPPATGADFATMSNQMVEMQLSRGNLSPRLKAEAQKVLDTRQRQGTYEKWNKGGELHAKARGAAGSEKPVTYTRELPTLEEQVKSVIEQRKAAEMPVDQAAVDAASKQSAELRSFLMKRR